MDAADGQGDPPPELRMAWMCANWNALPDSGGVNDQDYILMTRMTALRNTYNAVSRMRGLSGDAINTALSHSERVLLGKLQEMGLLRGLR